jgi:hypothetical protein
MKNKKRKQERRKTQAIADVRSLGGSADIAQTETYNVDRTKLLLGEKGDLASDSEDEFDEEYRGRFGTIDRIRKRLTRSIQA